MSQESEQAKPKKPKAKSKNHEVIGRFLDLQAAAGDKYFWPREMKMAGELLKKYPFEFLMQLREPFGKFKMQSLAWFKTQDGKKFLGIWYFEYQKANTNLTVEKEEIVLSESKIGEDIQIKQKPKTLKEFLNLYGKSNN